MDPVLLLEITNKEEEYEIEEVWNYRKQGYSMQLLVHWKEYRDEHNQWISEIGLPDTREAIEDCWTRILS